MTGEVPVNSLSRGRVMRSLSSGHFTLVESRYAAGDAIPRHAHGQSKISLVLAGGTQERHRGASDCYGPGSAVIKPCDAEHSNAFGDAGMRSLVISRRSDDSQAGRQWDASLAGYRWLTGGPLVRALFGVYHAARQPPGRDRDLLIEERLAAVMAALGACPVAPPRAPEWLGAVRDRLYEHAVGVVPATGLAQAVGTHPVYLARVFRRRYGCCMSEYVQRIRVGRALTLLARGDMPASQIALDAGFADQAHFCRVFKSHTGLTPGTYRRALGSG